jgi:hypothetical protein
MSAATGRSRDNTLESGLSNGDGMTGREMRVRIVQLGLNYTEAAPLLGLSRSGLPHSHANKSPASAGSFYFRIVGLVISNKITPIPTDKYCRRARGRIILFLITHDLQLI